MAKGTKGLEAAVKAWARKHRSNPLSAMQAGGRMIAFARECDESYRHEFKGGPKVYETCEQTTQRILVPRGMKSTGKKPWPKAAVDTFVTYFAEDIPEGDMILDELEHREQSEYAKRRGYTLY